MRSLAATAHRARGVARALPCLLAAACLGGQSTDDDRPCEPQRIPLDEPSSELLHTLERLQGRYEIGGRWGTPTAWVSYTPADAPFSGELSIGGVEGPFTQLSGCGMQGVQAPVRVQLRTDDGALDGTLDATVLLPDLGVPGTALDGSPAPFRAQLSARVDLQQLAGSFRVQDSERWTLRTAQLSAEITPFGTRGTLTADIEPRTAPRSSRNAEQTSPEPARLLLWPVDDRCDSPLGGVEGRGYYPASTEESLALHDALERVGQESFEARYDDGATTSVSVRIEAPAAVCGEAGRLRLPTTAQLTSSDGRVDVSTAVFLDPGFAQLHFNERTDVAWTFPPEQLPQRLGHLAEELTGDLSGFTQVGVEAWFDRLPEPAGWLKLLGYRAGDCNLCDAQRGCIECSWEARVTLMTLRIGAETGRQR